MFISFSKSLYDLPTVFMSILHAVHGKTESLSKEIELFLQSYNNLIFTGSCGAARFLCYKILNAKGLKGNVYVLPLTCEEAIIPIFTDGFHPCFIDVCPFTFNLCHIGQLKRIDKNTVAVQRN